MIRWACCGLVLLLAGAVVGVRAESCALVVRQVAPVKPNPLGGAPIALQRFVPVPGGLDVPPHPGGGNPRPIRPVFTLPGAPKLDRHGDPLPPGAIVRYGTVRLRHGADIQGIGFTPDGKFLCTVSGSDDSVKLWDPVSGKEAARLDGPVNLVNLAKNGSVFVVDDTCVRVWLPATNTVRQLPETTIPEGASPTAISVNPDGRTFALATDGKVLIIDAQTGKSLRELNLPGPPPNPNVANRLGLLVPVGAAPAPAGPPTPPPSRLLYSPDGRWLVGSGQKTGVWLWDLRTGKRVRTYRSELDFPEYAFSPDVTKLVVTGQQVHMYALDSEEPVTGFKGPQDLIGFAPRFSPDGKTLFVVLGDGSVQPLDAATGEEQEGFDPPEMNLRMPFALAPGGTTAAGIDQSGGIRIWDPKTGKGPEVSRLPVLVDPGFSTNGKSVTVLDQAHKIHTFDLATGGPGKVIELPGEENGLPTRWDAASRRAAVIVPSGEELEVQIIDADTGKVVSRISTPQNGGLPFVSFASANRDRAALFTQTGVTVVNPTTGKTVRTLNAANHDNGTRGAISPDGRLVAVQTQPLTVWEVATGKKRLTLDAVPNTSEIAFGPDARLLAAWDNNANIVVADMRAGTVVRRLQCDVNDGIGAIALSADGKRLAVGTGGGRVTVWDIASGDVLAPFAGHDGMVTGMVFTADGKKLVSTAMDGTALVWEVPDKPVQVGPVETTVTGFEEAFRLLGSPDAAQAQRGLDYLYKHPTDAVKQAAERMPIPSGTPAAKLAQYVEDLGSEEFATREAALKALEKIGGEASTALKHAAEKSSSAEVRKAAAELLGKFDAPVVRAEDLRILRTVEAMENLRSPEGRTQLEKWAAGPAGHRLTGESAAALTRLKALGGGK